MEETQKQKNGARDRPTDRQRQRDKDRERDWVFKSNPIKNNYNNLTSGTQEQEKRNHAFPCCDLSNQPVMTAAPFV